MTVQTNTNFSYISQNILAEDPEKLAFIEIDGKDIRTRSFLKLDNNINKVATYFSSQNLILGDRIALAIGNRIEFIESLLGVIRAGFVPVPLNYKLGKAALGHILNDADCQAIIFEPEINKDIPSLAQECGIKLKVSLTPSGNDNKGYDEIMLCSPDFKAPLIKAEAMAMLPYTSGSTGNPKGVQLTHAGQNWFVNNFISSLPEIYHLNTRALVAVPLFHKNAMAGAIKPLLKVGGTVILMRKFEAKSFLKAMSDYKCTYSTGVPAMYSLLLEERELISQGDFSQLEYLAIGSAPCAPALIEEIGERFEARVIQGYGLTEGGPVVFEQPPNDKSAPVESCGKLLPEIEVKFLSENGTPHPTMGELWVKNKGVTPGYYNLPEVNKTRLIDGWLATGDLFKVDDKGYYYFLGRTDDLMISGGENIYPAEVEKILMRHKDVLNICVISLAHKIKGEVPGAMLVVASGSKLTEDSLKKFFIENGPAYAHPRLISIVSEMPLSGTGKIDRSLVSDTLKNIWSTREHAP